jgi:hypothetical protein
MNALVQLLGACEAVLRSVGETFWSDNIRAVLEKNGNSVDVYLCEEILSWYGGMGSFNDLIISRYNDHLVDDKDEEKLNDELNRLRSEIYQEALRLRREEEATKKNRKGDGVS